MGRRERWRFFVGGRITGVWSREGLLLKVGVGEWQACRVACNKNRTKLPTARCGDGGGAAEDRRAVLRLLEPLPGPDGQMLSARDASPCCLARAQRRPERGGLDSRPASPGSTRSTRVRLQRRERVARGEGWDHGWQSPHSDAIAGETALGGRQAGGGRRDPEGALNTC